LWRQKKNRKDQYGRKKGNKLKLKLKKSRNEVKKINIDETVKNAKCRHCEKQRRIAATQTNVQRNGENIG